MLYVAFRLRAPVDFETARERLYRWAEGRRLTDTAYHGLGYILRRDRHGAAGVFCVPRVLGTHAVRGMLEADFGLGLFETIKPETIDIFLASLGSDRPSSTTKTACFCLTRSYPKPASERIKRSSPYRQGTPRNLIDRIFMLHLEGKSYAQITRLLSAEKQTSAAGRPFSKQLIGYLIHKRAVMAHEEQAQPRRAASRAYREPLPVLV